MCAAHEWLCVSVLLVIGCVCVLLVSCCAEVLSATCELILVSCGALGTHRSAQLELVSHAAISRVSSS